MQTPQEKVLEFYKAFGQQLPDSESQPSLTNELLQERIHLKMDLIFEEMVELVEAVYGKAAGAKLESIWTQVKELDDNNRDVVEAFDALADLLYVQAGLAIEANGDLDAVFAHVHESNMSKLGEDGKPVLSDGVTPAPDGLVKPKGKILKGPNYWAPNIDEVLGLPKN